MKKLLLIYSIGVITLTCSKCKVFDNEVIVPGYVYIPSVKFETPGDNSKGDSTTKITDVWIYSNGSLEGTIGLPALIPINKNGSTEIGIDAGILRSGQNNERIPYALATREYFQIDLSPNKVDTLRPVFKYSAACDFKMVEDFDKIGFRFDYTLKLAGDTVLPITGDSALNPKKKSGMVVIGTQTDVFSITTSEFYPLAGFGTPVFLEMDYNTDAILYIGLIVKDGRTGDVNTTPVYNAFPTNGWNKVYIDLAQEVSARPQGSTFKIYINVKKGVGSPSPKIILDNIKLIQG
jgi:hypothetical protein